MVVKNITVYCGSATGNDPAVISATKELGLLMAKQNFTLVYGGGRVGLMGILANTIMQNKGKVIGIIPKFLADREVAHTEITELHIVENMHERKMKMIQLADGFITLAGGLGSMEELFEVLTWRVLEQHHKPVGLLNTNGFYDPLLKMLAEMKAKGFVSQEALDHLLCEKTPADLLRLM
ncbi:MAG: TIGR00730 family Rossman fold protein [Bacteroidia bacterium]